MPNIEFTPSDKKKIQIVEQEICPDTFDDKELPSDVHIITYMYEGKKYFDVVRAYTMVDIFDAYYDKIKGKGEIVKIKSGYGRIKPKLYGKIDDKG